LDGFSVNPRITVCFSGPVDVATLGQGIKTIAADHEAPPIGINQVIFDPAQSCAYAKPDQVLDQQTRYTSDVADANGKKLKADLNYSDCVKRANSDYFQALSQALDTSAAKTRGMARAIPARGRARRPAKTAAAD